jgi:hypothetical protein
MSKILCTLAVILALGLMMAVVPVASEEKAYTGYTSLNPAEPITFDGNKVT